MERSGTETTGREADASEKLTHHGHPRKQNHEKYIHGVFAPSHIYAKQFAARSKRLLEMAVGDEREARCRTAVGTYAIDTQASQP